MSQGLSQDFYAHAIGIYAQIFYCYLIGRSASIYICGDPKRDATPVNYKVYKRSSVLIMILIISLNAPHCSSVMVFNSGRRTPLRSPNPRTRYTASLIPTTLSGICKHCALSCKSNSKSKGSKRHSVFARRGCLHRSFTYYSKINWLAPILYPQR